MGKILQNEVISNGSASSTYTALGVLVTSFCRSELLPLLEGTFCNISHNEVFLILVELKG